MNDVNISESSIDNASAEVASLVRETEASREARVAVVVGINEYDPARWTPLRWCANDAREVAALLAMPEYGFTVVELIDAEATTARIVAALMKLRESEPDSLAFYFAGHGVSNELGAYLVTYDNQDWAEGLRLDQLAQILTPSSQTQNSVAFLDCCHSGAAPLGAAHLTPLSPRAIEQSFPAALDRSRALIAACPANDVSVETDSSEHGVFTSHLIEGLAGNAADYEGFVTATSLYDYVAARMGQVGLEPVFRSDIMGRLILASGLPPQLGAPLAGDDMSRLEDQAEAFLDAYGRQVSDSYETWRESGYSEACQRLAPIYDWFQRRVDTSPQLMRRDRFKRLYSAMIGRVQQLGTIDEGTRVPEGVLVRSIGRGAFGAVWLVKPKGSAPELAYKVYHPNELHDAAKIARFQRGVEAMRQLDHPRVVKVRRDTSCPLGFFMEYVSNGANLRSLNPSTTLDAFDLVHLLIRVAETIEHAHNRNVIHRDIKPENIVCAWEEERWEPYLTDFDLAWFSTATQLTREAMGSIFYAAPEQLTAYQPNADRMPTLDVFGFGQVVYWCVVGADPDPFNLESNVLTIGRVLGSWPAANAAALMADFYRNATTLRPSERLPNFATVISRLRDVAAELHPNRLAADLTPEQFVRELAFAFTGRAGGSDGRPFATTSRKTLVQLEHRQRSVGGQGDIFTAVLTPSDVIGSPGLTHAQLQTRLDQRIDGALAGLPSARRRASQGGHESTIEFEIHNLTREAFADTRDALARVIAQAETTL
jgi:serine/threonine protein kinase